MNGKFEEKLAQLAFGDLSPEEAAQVEAQVSRNPEASQALADYRDMCGGLRSLAAVPEHQLSNERLRNAILTQGLRTKPEEKPSKGFGAGWIWMPVAACAMGFALITMRSKPAGDPQIFMGNAGANLSAKAEPLRSLFPEGIGSVLTKATTTPKKANPMMRLAMNAGSDESDPRNLPREKREKRFTDDATALKHPNWGPITPNPDEDPSTRMAFNNDPKATNAAQNAASQPVAMSSPIVLIDSNPDSETGAPVATEVGTASNILIGG